MSSISLTKEDEKEVAVLRSRFDGVSRTEAIRRAVRFCVRGSCDSIIEPQLAAPSDLREVAKTIRTSVEQAEVALRNGWPDHIAGETPQRAQRVAKARVEFDRTLAEFGPRLAILRTLDRVVTASVGLDINRLKAAAGRLDVFTRDRSERLAQGKVPLDQIESVRARIADFSELDKLLKIAGIARPASKPSPGTAAGPKSETAPLKPTASSSGQ